MTRPAGPRRTATRCAPRCARTASVLVRGLGLRDAAAVGAVFRGLAGTGLMAERESFAPRQALGGGVYSSTKWPANQPMCMHHELSYTLQFPGTMMFACLAAPAQGGATAVVDSPTVLDALPGSWPTGSRGRGGCSPAGTARRSGRLDRGVRDHDRAAVEQYCRANAIEFAWQPDGGLRTRQRRSAVVRHPVTGQRCWFNQIAFLNEWTMDHDVREYLVELYGEDGLPFNTCFGNGEPIGKDIVDLINGVYEANTAREPWQAGDLMLVDNIRTAHGREAYRAPRGAGRHGGRGRPGRLLPDRRGDRDASNRSADNRGPGRSRAAVRGDLRRPGAAGAAGPGEADHRAGRGHLPAARRGRLGQPAVVLPAVPGPPLRPDHRPARLDRREVRVDGLKWISSFPGNVAAGHPARLGGADPQRPRDRLSVRRAWRARSSARPGPRRPRPWPPTG